MQNDDTNIGLIAIGVFGLIVIVNYARKLKEPRTQLRQVHRHRPTTTNRLTVPPYRNRSTR